MTITDALTHSDLPEADALLLVGALLGLSRTEVLLARKRTLTPDEARTLEDWLTRRRAGEPVQHILGAAPFYGLTLRVTPDVLVPRPETEWLVHLALQDLALRDLAHTPNPTILDIGTGSGAVALALKAERPDARVWATDVSGPALAVARGNAERLGLAVTFLASDLLGTPEAAAVAREADLIVANLPYLPETDVTTLPPEVRRDPALALFAGPDGLSLARRLVREAHPLMRPGAALWLELDPRNAPTALAEATGWRSRRLEADLVGRERFVRLER